MNHLHFNRYSAPQRHTNRTSRDATAPDTGTLPNLAFCMPAQETVSMQTYRDLWQLWIEAHCENEQLHKRVMELEAEREARA